MMVEKYRKKPVIIEAIQLTDRNLSEVHDFMTNQSYTGVSYSDREGKILSGVSVKTLEGVMTAKVGDFIVKGILGEFYPCKPDIFKLTYDLVKI